MGKRCLGLLGTLFPFLVPILNLLELFLALLLTGQLGCHLQRVGALYQFARGIGFHVSERHGKGVNLITEHGVRDPISDGIMVLGIFRHQTFFIKVESLDCGQTVCGSGKIQGKVFRHGALRLQQMLVLPALKEEADYHIIGQVMGIGNHSDGVITSGIAPDGIHADVGLA